jgi:hypothetical protein
MSKQSNHAKHSEADGYYVLIGLISAVLLSILAIVIGLGLAMSQSSFALAL